jgi:hypothetical protein
MRQHKAEQRQHDATPRGAVRGRAVAGRGDQQHDDDVKDGDRDIEGGERIDCEHDERDDSGQQRHDIRVEGDRGERAPERFHGGRINAPSHGN